MSNSDFTDLFDYVYSCIYSYSGFLERLNGGSYDDFINYNVLEDAGDSSNAYWSACHVDGNADADHCFASKVNAEKQDPCLSYYEDGVCARCKFGSVRVFTD